MSFTFPLERLDETRRRLNRLESDFAARVTAWDPNRVPPLAELERSLDALRTVAVRCKADVDEAETALLAAMRDRKALELLKKRRFDEYAARKEERELDEANQA